MVTTIDSYWIPSLWLEIVMIYLPITFCVVPTVVFTTDYMYKEKTNTKSQCWLNLTIDMKKGQGDLL